MTTNKKYKCFSCDERIINSNTIGLNKKLLGRNIERFFCMRCLSDYLEITEFELNNKIEEFRGAGCKLFN